MSRFIPRLAWLMMAAAIAILALLPLTAHAQAGGQEAQEQPQEQEALYAKRRLPADRTMVGPVVWSPLATPIYPVKGADDRIHLVYELYITNESHLDYTDHARPRKVLFSAGTANSVPAIQVSSRIVPNGQGSCQDPARCYYDTIDYDYPDSGLPIPARADHNRVGEKPSVEIPNFGRVNDNYYRGAQPKGDAYRQLAALGVKMVVDLRNDATEYAKPSAEQSGLRYINLPLDDKRYPPVDAATRFLEIVTDPANWPVYVHCKGGRHRTEAMTAVYRMTVDDWDIDRAYEEMKEYGFYIRWGHECYKDYVYDYYRDLQADRQRRHSMIVQSALLRFSSSCDVGLTPALKRINATHNFFSGAPNSYATHWSYSHAALGQIDFGVVAAEIEMMSNALSKKNVLITSYLTT